MLSLTVLLALTAAASQAVVAAPSPPSFRYSSSPVSRRATSNATSYALTADGFTDDKWVNAFEKAKEVVAGMTLEEKINWSNTSAVVSPCTGAIPGIESANISSICFSDGPTGIRVGLRYSTQFPAEVTTAATWDRSLISARAEAMASEFKQVGVHCPLSIVAGPMGRTPWGGRNWEGFSPDPVLSGEATRLSVEAFQKVGVIGQVKHYFGNEQEWLRIGNLTSGFTPDTTYTLSSNIDAATVRELYTWPYAEAIRSGASSVMCSYNLESAELNGTAACEDDESLNKLLKHELNFPGAVVTDWGAGHTTLGTAINGTDFIESNVLWGDLLTGYIENGTVPEAVLNDKIIRWLVPYFALDQQNIASPDFNRFVATRAHSKVVREIAESSITLLKNVRSQGKEQGLPLRDDLKDLILVGSPAGTGQYGIVSNVAFWGHPDLPGMWTDGYGSGSTGVAYQTDPFTGITHLAREQDRRVVVDGYFSDNATEGTIPSMFGGADTLVLDAKLAYAGSAVVFVSTTATEGYDRESLLLDHDGEELINYVADRHNDTIVVVTAPGQIDMSSWIDHENVTAVLFSYFPTTEGGNAVASVLFGDVNPSGKLPFTIAKDMSDYNVDGYYNVTEDVPERPYTNFSEGVFLDYKRFDKMDVTPLYEFGYGMSYTNFSTSGLKVSKTKKTSTALVRETNEKYFVDGKSSSGLYDTAYTVKATVKNTGSVAGAEVVQLYLSFPSSTPREMPVRSLRGFAKQSLKAGESKTVSFELRNKDLAYYDVVKAGWVVPKGDFTVSVGSSSRKLSLTATLTV
ncbi:hypothetical protein JCM8547_009134 [Rhodosporidiobolus lusitaniae]